MSNFIKRLEAMAEEFESLGIPDSIQAELMKLEERQIELNDIGYDKAYPDSLVNSSKIEGFNLCVKVLREAGIVESDFLE